MTKTSLHFSLAAIIFLALAPSTMAQIQMLPPIQSGTANTVCPASAVGNILSWDGSTSIKCQMGVVVDNAGNVGIAAAPSAGHRLSVGSQINATGLPPFIVADSGDLVVTGGSDNRWGLFHATNAGALEKIGIEANGDIEIGSSIWTKFATNQVGIGTTSPQSKLDVAGGVRIGMDPDACVGAKAGTLRYNAGQVQVCNGASWGNAFGGSTTYSRTNEGTVNMGPHKFCFLSRVQSGGWGSATSWYCEITQSGSDWLLRSHFQRNSENMPGNCNCRATCID